MQGPYKVLGVSGLGVEEWGVGDLEIYIVSLQDFA